MQPIIFAAFSDAVMKVILITIMMAALAVFFNHEQIACMLAAQGW